MPVQIRKREAVLQDQLTSLGQHRGENIRTSTEARDVALNR